MTSPALNPVSETTTDGAALVTPPVGRRVGHAGTLPPDRRPVVLAGTRAARAEWWVAVGVFVLAAAIAILAQFAGGAYGREFGVWPDEAGHFITGVAVHDMLVRGALLHPVRFVEEFYRHYPNVTLGQWPPVLYGVEALWAAVAGVSRDGFLALSVLVTAAAATLAYVAARPASRWTAVLAAAFVVATPGVRKSLQWVGADLLVMLLGTAALLTLARYFARGRRRDALAYGALAGVAALTKGNGFALFLVPGLVIVLSGAWRLLRRPDLWLAGLVAVGVCLPWYGLTSGRFRSSFAPDAGVGLARHEFTVRAAHQYWSDIGGNFGSLGVGAAAAGLVWWALRSRRRNAAGEVRAEARARLTWPAAVLAGVAFHVFVPLMDIDVRYVLFTFPALAVTLALVGAEVGELLAARRVPAGAGRGAADLSSRAAPLTFAAFALLAVPFWPHVKTFPEHGIHAASVRVAHDSSLNQSRILLSSGSATETAILAELVALDGHRPGRVVLRAGQQLAQSGWSLENYQRRFDSPSDVARWLRRAGVRTVIFDHSPMSAERITHHPQLDSALALGDWQVVADYPGDPRVPRDSMHTTVYRYVGPAAAVTERVTVNAKGTVLDVPLARVP